MAESEIGLKRKGQQLEAKMDIAALRKQADKKGVSAKQIHQMLDEIERLQNENKDVTKRWKDVCAVLREQNWPPDV